MTKAQRRTLVQIYKAGVVTRTSFWVWSVIPWVGNGPVKYRPNAGTMRRLIEVGMLVKVDCPTKNVHQYRLSVMGEAQAEFIVAQGE